MKNTLIITGGVILSIALILTLPKFVLGLIGCWQIGSWMGNITIRLIKK